MAENNITPAVNLQQEEMPNEMSAAEFQQRLYAWFEDRGLLSELRAHLRKQMIGVLKDTAIGRTVSGQQKQVSPKLQALNLLIAEFLLQQEYHYSLSVFSTEVPLISVLPEFPGLTMSCTTSKNDDGKKWQFSEKDMWDILETLGVQRDTDEGKNIFSAYYNGANKEPLLTCIVRMLHALQSKSRTSLISETKETENKKVQSSTALENSNSEPWLKTVNDILSSNNAQDSERVMNVLKKIIAAEKKRLKGEAREEFLKLQMTLQSQTARKEEEQRKKIAVIQNSIDNEKTKLESEKNDRQFKLNEFEQRVQRHRDVLRERYQALHVRERDVHEREHQLRQREEFLNAQQLTLETAYENLYREQRTVSDLQEKLQRELREKQKAAKNDAEFLKDLQEECTNMRNQITNTQEAVLNVTSKTVVEKEQSVSADLDIRDAEQALVKGLIRQLQIENSGLRTLNSEQQFRIDELSQRAVVLMHDLENSQAAVTANHSALRNGVLSAPPLAAPDTRRLSRFGSSNSGAGEEGHRPTLATSPTEFRHYPSVRDPRRRVPPRKLTIHSSSSSDDHSPTNDVLQEARERLNRLEKESEEVDRHYRQFRSRQAQIDHHFYQRNSNLLRPFESYNTTKNGESGSNFQFQQGARSSNMNLNPEAVSHMFAKYQPLHGNANEASGSQSVSRNHHLKSQRDTSNSCNNEAPCCSNFSMNQKNKINLAQLVEWHFNQAISCMANNQSMSETSLQDENRQGQDNAKEAEKEESDRKDREEERQFDNQSVASSGILGEMLAAGTSGVSLSDIEASNEKSESQPENLKD